MPTVKEEKLKILMEEAQTPLTRSIGGHNIFLELPNSKELDNAIKHQAILSGRRLGVTADSNAVATMDTVTTLRNFSPQAKQRTQSLITLLNEFRAKKRSDKDQLSQIDAIEHLQMIYRASGAAMQYIRQVGTLADCYLFPVLRAVHWTASDKMERLLPNRIAASPKANSHLYFSRPAQLGGRDVGEIVMSHTGMTGHGHKTDKSTDNVYLSEQEARSWKIYISNGKLHAFNNCLPLDTTNANRHAADARRDGSGLPKLIVGPPGGEAICENSYGYVMSTQGHLFAAEQTGGVQKQVTIGIKPRTLPIYHSSYLAGNDIRCGGRIFVQNGVLKGIDNASGHYQPTRNKLRDVLLELKRQNVNLDQTYVLDWSDSNFEKLGIRKDLAAVNEAEVPWQTVKEFFDDKRDYGVSDKVAKGWKPHIKKVVDKYRKHSRGIFSRTSQETLTALAVLQGLEGDDRAYFMASVFYAHYKSTKDWENNGLKNFAGYVARNQFVRLTPLEQVKKRNGQLKSGFRRKLIAALPNIEELFPKR